jgi:uncharacterized lipoprotein YajG
MDMKKLLKLLLIALVAGSLLTACADPPNAKVTEAKAVIQSVIDAGGEQFAPEKVASIQKRFQEAMAEIDTQNKNTFKNYNTAEFTLNQLMDDCDMLKNKIAESKGQPVVAFVSRIKAVE